MSSAEEEGFDRCREISFATRVTIIAPRVPSPNLTDGGNRASAGGDGFKCRRRRRPRKPFDPRPCSAPRRTLDGIKEEEGELTKIENT